MATTTTKKISSTQLEITDIKIQYATERGAYSVSKILVGVEIQGNIQHRGAIFAFKRGLVLPRELEAFRMLEEEIKANVIHSIKAIVTDEEEAI